MCLCVMCLCVVCCVFVSSCVNIFVSLRPYVSMCLCPCVFHRLGLVLVDHNRLRTSQEHLGDTVVEIIDHHKVRKTGVVKCTN